MWGEFLPGGSPGYTLVVLAALWATAAIPQPFSPLYYARLIDAVNRRNIFKRTIILLYLYSGMRVKDINKELLIRKKTIEIVVKHGLDGLSMHKIAKAAGVSVNTIYLNFKNREDLIIQVYSGILTQMEEVLLRDFRTDMDFADGLRLQWKNRLEYCLKYPKEVAFTEQIRYSHLYEKVMDMQGRTFSTAMQAFSANAIAKGQLIQLSAEVYWSIAYAPLYQLIKFHYQKKSMSGRKFTLSQELLDAALNRIIPALTP
ncbi:TetR/AcrR family transcriptional regulator [Chitinophagaceae bacterium MMS25-I14]